MISIVVVLLVLYSAGMTIAMIRYKGGSDKVAPLEKELDELKASIQPERDRHQREVGAWRREVDQFKSLLSGVRADLTDCRDKLRKKNHPATEPGTGET